MLIQHHAQTRHSINHADQCRWVQPSTPNPVLHSSHWFRSHRFIHQYPSSPSAISTWIIQLNTTHFQAAPNLQTISDKILQYQRVISSKLVDWKFKIYYRETNHNGKREGCGRGEVMMTTEHGQKLRVKQKKFRKKRQERKQKRQGMKWNKMYTVSHVSVNYTEIIVHQASSAERSVLLSVGLCRLRVSTTDCTALCSNEGCLWQSLSHTFQPEKPSPLMPNQPSALRLEAAKHAAHDYKYRYTYIHVQTH